MIRRPQRSTLFPSTTLFRSQRRDHAADVLHVQERVAPGRDRRDSGSGDRLRRTGAGDDRSEEHTSELQSRLHLVCRLLLEKKKKKNKLASNIDQTTHNAEQQ